MKKKEKVEEVEIISSKNTSNPDSLSKTLILGLVGLIWLLIPGTLNKLIGILIGAALLITGILAIIKYTKENINGSNLNLVSGILYAVLGVIIIIYPYSIINLVTICLGVYLIINGLLKLKLSFVLKRVTDKWIGTLVMGIITVILGILLIFNPFAGITITKIAGAFLVIVAIFDLIDTYIIQKWCLGIIFRLQKNLHDIVFLGIINLMIWEVY